MQQIIQTGVLVTGSTVTSSPAGAAVFVDPDRYGDKELKIATVNKIRQNIRNAINTNPDLASTFVKIAIQDALTYDPNTQEGGPDGSIVAAILDQKSKNVEGLKAGAEKLNEIAKLVKRTTEITMADVVSFAGAEAIESVGGPRIVVQLGKMDPKGAMKKASSPATDLSNGQEVVNDFLNVGLTEREVALLFGAMGGMDVVATKYKSENQMDDEEDEPNEMGDVDVFIPSSFGAPKEIYGKQLGALDNKYFASVVTDAKKGKMSSNLVFADDKVMQWAKKYADNKNGFLKDLPEAYGKLMALGTKYTGGKVGSLLGQKDDDY